ncbi:MAG TPA: YbdK family carboxylate-amine ligase [Gemmataceae bacterium]|nr:YbdK family carboxylate-amine ligase [Gemmataceae bacterium]
MNPDLPDEAAPASKTTDDGLVFRGSSTPTLGVEMEMQILDRESGDLAPGAVRILKMCAEEKVEGVAAELMQSMIEVKTGICRDVQEARNQLLPILRKVRIFAASLGYELALGGTHPFHRSGASTVFPAERYERIMERLAWLTYQRVVFGLHVHVGVPDGDLAMGVTSLLVKYLPHLLAVSANSPFWQGVDTGLASSRAALSGLLPHAGVPPHFGKWKDFRIYCTVMRDCQAIASYKDIYWDIRPRPDFGTIEFRICDMPPTLKQVFAIVALTRCLVISALRLIKERPRMLRGDLRRHWIAGENKWLATRYGLAAMYIRTPAGKRRLLKKDLAELIDKMTPIARETGDFPFFAPIQRLDAFESGSDQLRNLFRATGNWKGLTDHVVRRFADELESLK